MPDTIDQNRLADLAARLVEAGTSAGAETADVVAVTGVSLGVTVRLGKVEEIERREGHELGLRVMIGQRQASVSTNDARPETFAALAERAVAMARLAPEDPYAGLADPTRLARDVPDLDLLDETPESAEGLRERALAGEAAALDVAGVTHSGSADASWSLAGIVLVTSHGFSGAYLGSRRSISVSALAGTGTGMERDYDFSSCVYASDLEDAAAIGRRAGEKAVRRLDPRKVSTRKGAVVYDPRVASSLVGHIAAGVNGASIARGSSFLAGKIGEKLFADGIRITDDPLRRRGLASKPFDGEGLATRPLDLVADGMLKSYVLDCATARELGLDSTGHARRGTGGPPSPGTTNLALMPGAVSARDLIAGIGEGLYVTDLMGSGVNMITGDYSRGAAGFWIENGELSYPVAEVTIAGNLGDMFARLTVADDLVWKYSVNAPTVAVEGLTIAGR